MANNNIIFITGTDTGVGKTVLTGLLLSHLRRRGCHALAIKPFCSGGLQDVRALQRLQPATLTASELNPFFFPEPIAPLAAARKHHQVIRIEPVLDKIRTMARRCDILLVEGAGGLLVPLGEGFTAADLIRRLHCETIVVAANRLGTINHTLLTVQRLRQAWTCRVQAILMDTGRSDPSVASNRRILTQWLAPTPLIPVNFLGRNPLSISKLQTNLKKSKKSIAQLCASSIVCALFFANRKTARRKSAKKLESF